jgi:hypothetical protein
LMNATWNTQQ